MKELVAVLGDDIIGHLYEDNTGKPLFEYTDQWKENPDATMCVSLYTLS